MSLILLLSAIVLGQNCGAGGCPAPSLSQGPGFAPLTLSQAPVSRPATVVPRVEGRDYYVIGLHAIRHKGLTFTVKGYVKDASTGIVTWEPSDEYNRLSYAAAVARQAASQAKPAPDAKAVPIVRPEPGERTPSAEPGPPLEVDKPAPVGRVRKPRKFASGDDKPVGQVPGMALNYGLDPSKMRRGSTYTAATPEARRFVEDAHGDRGATGRLHVTVIGTDAERGQVMNDLTGNPAFADLQSTMMVQDYTRDEWPVDPALGFKVDGRPTILVQTTKSQDDPEGGKVVYRASDYSMGPLALAEAIRKANPHYKPSVDPGPSSGLSSSCPLGFTREHWPYILIAGVAIVFFARLPRKGV